MHISKFVTLKLLILLFLFSTAGDQAYGQLFKKKEKNKKDQIEGEAPGKDSYRKAEYFLAEAEKYFILEDYAKAFVLYQKSLEYDQDNATAYFKISKIYQNSEEYDKSLSNALKAVSLDKKNKYFYLQVAEIYSEQNNYSAAIDTYKDMFANCKDTDEYLFELAALYIYQEQYDKAIEVYNDIERIYGINEQVVRQKQKLYIQEGNLDGAVEEGEKLIKAFPDEASYIISLAEILVSNDQEINAIRYLEDFLKEQNEDDPSVKLMLSELYKNQGNIEKSRQYLRDAFSNPELDLKPKLKVIGKYLSKLPNSDIQALCDDLIRRLIETHSDNPDVFAVAGDFHMKVGDKEKAKEMYEKAIDAGSNSFNIWYNLIQLASTSGDYDGVIKYAEQALEYYPNQPEIYFFLGNGHMLKKQYEDAVEIFETGKNLIADNDELKSMFNAQLGDAYNYTKEYDKSDAAYEAVLEYNPNNDHVLNNYSYFLSLRKDKLDLAEKMSTKLIKRNPENATFLDTHAWVLYMNGNFKEARHYIEKAIAIGDVSGTVIEHYGDILFKLGMVDSAVKQWQKAKGMDETSELIDKKIADRKLYE